MLMMKLFMGIVTLNIVDNQCVLRGICVKQRLRFQTVLKSFLLHRVISSSLIISANCLLMLTAVTISGGSLKSKATEPSETNGHQIISGHIFKLVCFFVSNNQQRVAE